MTDFLRFMALWDIWSIIGILMASIPSIFLFVYLFPWRRIKNVYIDTKQDVINETYPRVIVVSLTNHTCQPLYVISEGFKFGHFIKPSPAGAKNAATEVYEVKFEGRIDDSLSEIDTLIRPNQTIKTWIPVDPAHTEHEIGERLKKKEIGILRLKCLELAGKRQAFISLKLKI